MRITTTVILPPIRQLRKKPLWVLFLLLTIFFVGGKVAVAENTTLSTSRSPHAVVKLVSKYDACTLDSECELGFLFELEPGWHIYWKNPGDSGSPPKFSIIEPTQFAPISLRWPVPHKIPLAHLVNYGYEDSVLLPFSISPKDLQSVRGDSFPLQIEGEWLVCNEDCIPGVGTFRVTVPIRGSKTISEHSSVFDSVKSALTPPFPEYLRAAIEGTTLTVTIQDTALNRAVQIYPEEKGLFAPSHEFSKLVGDNETIFSIPMQHAPKENPSWLVVDLGNRAFSVPLSTSVSNASKGIKEEYSEPIPEDDTAFISLLLFALIGGIVLNCMPCVFPIIAMKAVTLLSTDHSRSRERIIEGSGYAFGIITSLWALFGIIVGAKFFGVTLGWGFQLQNPSFTAAMTILFFLFALNLYGAFEFAIGFTGRSKTGTSQAFITHFFSGVLTTVISTPCTAPLMGVSIAYALSAPVMNGFLIFTFLGIGLALPYFLLVTIPKLAALLPRPGHWMVRTKQFLSFPLFLSALWLFTVLLEQVSTLDAKMLLLYLIVLVFVLWIKKNFGGLHASKLKRRLTAALVIGTALSIAIGVSRFQPPNSAQAGDGTEVDTHGLTWRTYSASLVENLRKENKKVYLDFTASWCITCQVNKYVVFSSPQVKDFIQKEGIVLVRGDWTNQDPTITEALKKYHKISVPLNVVIDPLNEDVTLPSILTPQIFLDALASGAK